MTSFTDDRSALRRMRLLRHAYEHSKVKFRNDHSDNTSRMTCGRISRLYNRCSSIVVALDTSNNGVNIHIENYAAPQCLSICKDMQAKLPRELRDMIYPYLILDKQPLIEESEFLPHDHPDWTGSDLLNSRNRHLLDARFSDLTTRREFLELWYQRTTFTFVNYEVIPLFLERDLWNLDPPVRNLVRRVLVWPWGSAKDMSDTPSSRAERVRLLANTEPLFRFDTKVDVFIKLASRSPGRPYPCITGADDEQIVSFVLVFLEMLPWLKRLLDMGHRVRIKVDF
jgi:hypothetical protein